MHDVEKQIVRNFIEFIHKDNEADLNKYKHGMTEKEINFRTEVNGALDTMLQQVAERFLKCPI
jgi:hypothetical protein